MQSKTSRDLAKVSLLALAIGGFSSPAAAEEVGQAVEEVSVPAEDEAGGDQIIVTGSRIARANEDTVEPVVVLDSQAFEARGFETIGQALNEQPAFGLPGASPIGSGQSGAFGAGQSYVNFLGLGSQRTLTLVNGHRFVSSNNPYGAGGPGNQVDLNLINTRLIDRVETVATGGAPIYGSDAVAGTVNIILKRDYQGIELDAQYGISGRGDAPNYRLRAIAGTNFADGRGNVVVSGEFNKGRGLLNGDRTATAAGYYYGLSNDPSSPFANLLYRDVRLPSNSEFGIPIVGGGPFGLELPLSRQQSEALFGPGTFFTGGTIARDGSQLRFDANGNLIPIDFGSTIGPDDGFSIFTSGGNGLDILGRLEQLLTDTKRYSGNVLGSFELADNVRLFGELWHSYSRGTNLQAQPPYNSGAFAPPFNNLRISIDNPFLTPAARDAIRFAIQNNPISDQNLGVVDEQNYFYLTRTNNDLFNGVATTATRVYRALGGLEGSFDIGDRKYNWEAVANYGRAKTVGRTPSVVEQNFQNAVNAVRDANGNIVCAPGAVNAAIETLSSACVPLNLFGFGRSSQAARDYVTTIAETSTTNEQWVVTASVAGPLFQLPGGDLNFAFGYEHRDESTYLDPGLYYGGGDDPNPTVDSDGNGVPDDERVVFGRDVPILPVRGGYNTDELFGELRADIVSPSNNVPGIYALQLQAAARFVNHSITGSDWTYTAGGRWSPIRDIAVRASYTRAIRSPAITEIFNPSTATFGTASDPCDKDNRGNGPDPQTRQANCAAAGIPADFDSLSDQREFRQAVEGNVDLRNEKSDAWSVGAVITPRFASGLTLTADYLSIKLKDAIANFGATQVVNACYDAADFPDNDFCGSVERDPSTNELTFIQTRYFNAAAYDYKALLASLSYNTRTPFLGNASRIGATLSYQYLDKFTTRATELSAPTKVDGSVGYSKHQAFLNLYYDNGPVGLNASLNYIGKADQSPNSPKNAYEYRYLDDVLYVNVGARFDVSERMGFRLSVENLFDTGAPFPVVNTLSGGAGTATYFTGILGRFFRAGASIRF